MWLGNKNEIENEIENDLGQGKKLNFREGGWVEAKAANGWGD
jgi:hypothetical protein